MQRTLAVGSYLLHLRINTALQDGYTVWMDYSR